MRIRSTEIEELSKYPSNYTSASRMQIQEMLRSLSIKEVHGHLFVSGSLVHAGHLSEFELEISEYGEILDHYCSCPFHEREDACGHIIALSKYLAMREFKLPYHLDVADEQRRRFKEYQKQQKELQQRRRQRASHQWLQEETSYSICFHRAPQQTGTIILCIELKNVNERYEDICQLELRIHEKNRRAYVVRDLSSLLEKIQNEEYHAYGNELGFVHHIDAFDEASQQILFFVRQLLMNDSRRVDKRAVLLNPRALDILANMLQSLPRENCNVHLIEKQLHLHLKLNKRSDYWSVALTGLKGEDGENLLHPLSGQRGIYGIDEEMRVFYRYSADKEGRILRLYQELLNEGELILDKDDFQQFYRSYLIDLSMYIEWEGSIDPADISVFEDEILLYLDIDEEQRLCAKLEYVYDKNHISAFVPNKQKVSFKALAIKDFLMSFAASVDDKGIVYLTEDVHWSETIEQIAGVLKEQCQIFISEPLRKIQRPRQLSLAVGVRMENDLLSLQLNSEDVDLSELADLLKSYRRKKKYYRLRNGDMVALENDSIKEVNDLFEQLQLKEDQLHDGLLTLPRYRLYNLDVLSNEQTHVHYDQDAILRQQQLLQTNSSFVLPLEFEKILRDYQKIGFQWLKTLSSFGFGGLLADDMGLGKTIQILAYLRSEQAQGKQSLVVCPASLLLNWQDEAKRFAKKLVCAPIYGNKEERRKRLEEGKHADLVITSYDYLKRDLDMYRPLVFDTVILDEAQYISNPNTKNAKAVKSLQARQRFALSGTPIENTLTELWSIFDFLLPGYLYTHAYFSSIFEKAIVKDRDEQMTKRLQALVRPFLLRRSKQEVLNELPDKEEHTLFFEFEKKERALYLANAANIRMQITDEHEQRTNTIKVLALITRLRQLCQDARLVYENVDTASSKLKGCMELIHRCMRSNKKMLLFSSFTSMLELIAIELEKEGIRYYQLTGSVPKEKRHQTVEQFQKDDTPIFLISLKAGGTGLNLTAAEVVIHFDPWWNLSAQNQATDRAYRIGQHNNVQVFQLIMKDSIEERIQDLQAKKKDLADLFVTTQDHNLLRGMSREELLELFR